MKTKRVVRQIVALLLLCCMVMSLAACGSRESAVELTDVIGKLTDSAEQVTQPVGQDLKVENTPVSFDNVSAAPIVENQQTVNGVPTEQKPVVNIPVKQSNSAENGIIVNNDETHATTVQTPVNTAPEGEYNKGVVLVKFKEEFEEEALGELKYTDVEILYEGSKWYVVHLREEDKTEEAVKYLTELGTFEKVDYDYVMGVTADVSSVDVSGNPNASSQTNLGVHNIPYGWTQNGKAPGGSPDVVVAVIDTGVDYNHVDLRNNIWVNTAEIPDNGIDDDANGYVDDIRGWDCVNDDKDPMDDNGHGTHVAGIVAAENNKVGGIGVAYNCKVMVLKAGNSSGSFNNSDIAEAIQYAYMNGADVINMSFGGSVISLAAEEALENAYNTTILVAAAGNSATCNQTNCMVHSLSTPAYPASLPFVIGVMSVGANGQHASYFTNFDHFDYNNFEYEVYAVGENVSSCWPNNKYAVLNGTSMAAPTVSGIAALLRSYLPDREQYSTKYIQSQIVNTGEIHPYVVSLKSFDYARTVADLKAALTQAPKPALYSYDCEIDDSPSIYSGNNGNGVMDAGETVHLYISLLNRGGVASDVNLSIDTIRNDDPSLTDPYFTFVNSNIHLSDIGTYSIRDSGDKYFEIRISPDCPNDYRAVFNIRCAYKNGMDASDNVVYRATATPSFTVSRGYHLPAVIGEDTTFAADRLYIVGESITIPAGVTVTFEEGCQIQVYDDREYYYSPVITVYGQLIFNGTKDNMIKIAPNDTHTGFCYGINCYGTLLMNYVDSINLKTREAVNTARIEIYNSYLVEQPIYYYAGSDLKACYVYDAGQKEQYYSLYLFGNVNYESKNTIITGSFISISRNSSSRYAYSMNSIENSIICLENGAAYHELTINKLSNTIVYSQNSYNNFGSTTFKLRNTENCTFITRSDSINELMTLKFLEPANAKNNSFSAGYQKFAAQVISDYIDANGNPITDVYGKLADVSKLWPHVVNVEMFDKEGNAITRIGCEEIKVRVTFNRPMDTTKDTSLTFGTIEPYADYKIEGAYVSDTVWEGTYTLKAQIENGQNFLKINNACAAEDQTKTVFGEYQLHEFTIDTTAAMSMNLQAVAKEAGIELTFAQDDYDTLLGYNVYRSEEKDGNYVKLNPAILLPTESTFLDVNAEPGKAYWYTYTVVLTDFTESNPAGKVMATALDTMSPSLYHTPVNQGYENNNLVISATASDNVGISNVTLYYRTVGAETWKNLAMTKVNDKFSAKIFGSEVTLAGLEYYIVATDGINTVQKGSVEAPYTVAVKSADALLGVGDVDGNGSVTAKDALMLMQCLGGELLLTDDQFKRADLNGDTVLSAAEALRILQYVNGKVTSLEM